MRRSVIFLVVPLCLCGTLGTLCAQSEILLQGFEIYDPLLSASIFVSQQAGDCDGAPIEQWQIPPVSIACTAWGSNLGTAIAADGTLIKWVNDNQTPDPSCPSMQRSAIRVFVTRPGGATQEVIRSYSLKGLGCGMTNCGTRLSSSDLFMYDVTNGALVIHRDTTVSDCTTGVDLGHNRGQVVVTGFPRLFETLLTFIPDAQTISLLTPAHPDGFPFTDSLQVWTGNLRTLPDWSQAQPLTCAAATNPAPGQIVTVPDTLPSPPVGQGRYYISASQHGTDRRLGRQFIDGFLSARDPDTLPLCQ